MGFKGVYISRTCFPDDFQFFISINIQDENATSRPVCSFVKPLRAGRLLDTPREAARFVSLMYLDKEPTLGGGGRAEQWTSMHAFMCRNKGVRDFHFILYILNNSMLAKGLKKEV